MSTNENPTSARHEQGYLSFWFSLDTTASINVCICCICCCCICNCCCIRSWRFASREATYRFWAMSSLLASASFSAISFLKLISSFLASASFSDLTWRNCRASLVLVLFLLTFEAIDVSSSFPDSSSSLTWPCVHCFVSSCHDLDPFFLL